jgi:cytochrome P450
MIAYGNGSPEVRQALANVPDMLRTLAVEVADRRRQPRDDLLTSVVQIELEDGRRLTDDETVAALWNLVGGGLDTTTSLTSLTLHYLDQHPDRRAHLVHHLDDPDLLDSATEEFLRYFSVNESLTRTVTRDVELAGQQLQRGDHLMLSWLSANRDERAFDCPDDVVLDREPNPHLAFGVGPHRCIGSHMARTLFQVMMREVLSRIPDYQVDRAATRFYRGNPELAGVVQMPATFSPGARRGPSTRPF